MEDPEKLANPAPRARFTFSDGRLPFDRQLSETFVLALLTALAEGPIGEAIIGVARGSHQIVLKENIFGAGWVVRFESTPTEPPPKPDWRDHRPL